MRKSAAVLVACPRGRSLVLRRGKTDPWMPGAWCFPGGRVDAGETPREAAEREAFEEAGLLLGRSRFMWKMRTPGGELFIFQAKSKDGCVHLLDGEHDAYIWGWPRDLIRLPLVPYARDVLEMVRC